MTEASVIGAGTVISGHVRGQGSLEILGRVEGDVDVTGNVVIGAGGRVRGTVNGAELRISGQVQGDLRGAIAVLLEAGARVAGDISAPRVAIAPGALARGHVQTDGEPAPAAARIPATAARPLTPPTRLAA
jgi:cytoskeletal protein CcmA (bactofilin family)